jgi:nucleoside-diphosphate-sugar epimerase
VPSTADISLRRLTELLAEAADTKPSLAAMTHEQLAALAAADPLVAEVTEMLYMVERPAVLDSAETRRLLGVAPTPLADVVAKIVATARTIT